MTSDLVQKLATLERNKVSMGTVAFHDTDISYYVTAKDMPMREHQINFEAHLGYWGHGLLFISEAVPKHFRQYLLWQKLREQLDFGGVMKQDESLLVAKEELMRVPTDLTHSYILFRTEQLRRLLELYGQEDESIFTASLTQSLCFWEKQCEENI